MTTAHVSSILTDFALGFTNGQYVGASICPGIPVDHWKDQFYTHRRRDVLTPKGDIIGPESPAPRLSYERDVDSYLAIDHGNETVTTDRERKDADGVLDIQKYKMSLVLNNLLLNQEIRIADFFDTAGNYASANQIAAGAAWNLAGADPIKDIQDAINALASAIEGKTKTVAVIEQSLWFKFQRHDKVRQYMAALDRGPPEQSFLSMFGVDELHVSKADKNTAAEGATDAIARIWDTDKFRVARVPVGVPRVTSGDGPLQVFSMFAGRFQVQQGQTAKSAMTNNELMECEVLEVEQPLIGAGRGSLVNKLSYAESDPKLLQNTMASIVTGC